MLETQKQLDAEFAQGAIGFWFSGGWLIEKIRAEHPDLRYGITLMPQPAPGAGSRASFAGGEYLAVPVAAKNAEGARDLIQFLTAGGNALAFCKQVTEAGYPADRHFQSDPFFVNDPHRATFIAQLAAARFTPVHPQWLDIEKIIEDEVVEAMYGRKTTEQALSEAQSEIDAVLARP
jgi:multiple sugar transport system substrate-binding protein